MAFDSLCQKTYTTTLHSNVRASWEKISLALYLKSISTFLASTMPKLVLLPQSNHISAPLLGFSRVVVDVNHIIHIAALKLSFSLVNEYVALFSPNVDVFSSGTIAAASNTVAST